MPCFVLWRLFSFLCLEVVWDELGAPQRKKKNSCSVGIEDTGWSCDHQQLSSSLWSTRHRPRAACSCQVFLNPKDKSWTSAKFSLWLQLLNTMLEMSVTPQSSFKSRNEGVDCQRKEEKSASPSIWSGLRPEVRLPGTFTAHGQWSRHTPGRDVHLGSVFCLSGFLFSNLERGKYLS